MDYTCPKCSKTVTLPPVRKEAVPTLRTRTHELGQEAKAPATRWQEGELVADHPVRDSGRWNRGGRLLLL